ncbi:MAG: nucleoside hydrolase [Lactobacillus sp.]|nr:nucleoside hydrolase [Lactobacillus sp.]
MTKHPLIISTDPGIDDAVAIMLALSAPEIDVKMIVPTWGNVSLEKTLNNTLKLLKFAGKKVPVVAGAKVPLMREVIDASDVHGKSGMDGYDFGEIDPSPLVSGLASEKIHEIVNNSAEPVELMQIGPATDFALYFRQYPDDLPKIKQLVIMGGAIGGGNWGPYAEYNVAGDPEASKIVFNSGVKIIVAPLEMGHQAYLLPEEVEKISGLSRTGQMLHDLLVNLHDVNESDGLEIYDALALGMLIDPSMFTFKPAYVGIDTNETGFTYGASAMDFSGFFGKKPNAEIGVKIDRDRFSNWLLKRISEAD